MAMIFRASLGAVGAAADKKGPTSTPPFLIAKGGARILLLVDGECQSLARLRVVEGRVKMVRTDDAVGVDQRHLADDDTGCMLEDRNLIVRQLVDYVDLTAL